MNSERLSDQGKIPFKIPRHIAIVMDGNARWAKAKNLSLNFGHKSGAENIQSIVEACIEFGVKYLTIYAFSHENWQRPKNEVEYLMTLLDSYLQKNVEELMKLGTMIKISGDLSNLKEKTQKRIHEIEEKTKNNKALTLNVAFSYGARQEIVAAAKKLIVAVENDEIKFGKINEDVFGKMLYQPEFPDPDLLVRTAGDLRISNFLLWQLAYTELYFTEVLWPDFNKNHLWDAIIEFNKRERRYGKR